MLTLLFPNCGILNNFYDQVLFASQHNDYVVSGNLWDLSQPSTSLVLYWILENLDTKTNYNKKAKIISVIIRQKFRMYRLFKDPEFTAIYPLKHCNF